MEDQINDLLKLEGKSLKDYILLLRNNFLKILVITIVSLILSIVYSIIAPNIYKAVTSIKVIRPKGSVLEAPMNLDVNDLSSDRFIANEIEVLKSHTIKEKVALFLLDIYKKSTAKDSFSLIVNKDFGKDNNITSDVKSINEIISILSNSISIDQKTGLDIIDISVESPSPYEATLIANEYASVYDLLNLQSNRQQLTNNKNFLENMSTEKRGELNKAEDSLRIYKQSGGIIELDEQARSLIDQLTNFETQKNSANIELVVAKNNLVRYKEKLAQQDPQLANYLQSFAAEPYLKSLQEEIAKLETKRDIAMLSKSDDNGISEPAFDEFNEKIKSLKDKVNDKISIYKAGIFASSPEEVKSLTQKIIEEETKVQAFSATIQELNSIIQSYDRRFSTLPKASIDLAKLERSKSVNEKIYLLVQEKYQEAIINEQSQPGNVQIFDYARIPYAPSKPNRKFIIVIGFALGLVFGFGFVLIKDYFDITIKTPEDIQNKNINILSYIPKIDGFSQNDNKRFELIVESVPDSIPSEMYRALRTRIQFSRINKGEIKMLLITSSAPKEGKTVTALNLAGCFAQTGKRTLLLDCDIRRPRLHSVFAIDRIPGLTDYLIGKTNFDRILRFLFIKNLYLITAGTSVPNPSELLGSDKMLEFLNFLRKEFDFVIIDSAPMIPVTDSDILSRLVDGTILVASANNTEMEVMQKSVEVLKQGRNSFLGVVLNNFNFKNAYRSYYKYNQYYSESTEEGKKKSKKFMV